MRRGLSLKSLCLVAACGTSLFFASAIARAAISDGLVSYWPLNGDLNDAAGSNHGMLMGTDTVANLTAGKFGNGIDLDGIDQYIDAGNDSSLDMSVATGPAANGHVSMSAWFRVDGFNKTWQALIAKGEGSAYRVARRGDEQEIAYAGGSGEAAAHGLNVNDGGLHHMVAISENGVSTRLWVDGMLRATAAAPSINNAGNAAGSNPSLYIGNNPQTGNRTWDGIIDDVAIWNRPLTPLEIGMIWDGGTGNSIEALLGGGFVEGDVNGDRVADTADYVIIRDNFSNSPAVRSEGDLNFDSVVDLHDFREWRNAAFPAAAIPEPGAAALLALTGLLATVGFRRRRIR